MASAAREASRQWREANPERRIRNLDELLEWVQQGRPGGGVCFAPSDGVDTSVTLMINGEEESHDCVGGEWAEFHHRFFEIIDEAVMGADARVCPEEDYLR